MPNMTITNLLSKILSLNAKFIPENTLKNRAFSAYQKKIINNLTVILNRNHSIELKDIVEQLKQFLASIWKITNGTAFSYTALPNDELTLLLCDVALFIKENTVLEENYMEEDCSVCLLKLLMPTVNLEAVLPSSKYPNLDSEWADTNIQYLLNSHILGRQGYYLIPVVQLTALLDQSPQSKKWFNQYYNVFSDGHDKNMARLTQEERVRLVNHSDYTKALDDAQKQYDSSIKEQQNLFSNLKQLCRNLYFNSVDGIGSEEDAGSGVYNDIIQFNDYYTRLSEDSKKDIPKEVKQEIDLLLNVSSDPTNIINDICIATRREQLEAKINPHEKQLLAIGLNSKEQLILIAEKKQQVCDLKIELKKRIEQQIYVGHDKLPLTQQLMNELHIDYVILSLEDLQELMQLNLEEITSLCQNPNTKQQVANQFEDKIEDFVIFALETSPAKLEVLLSACQKELADNLLEKCADMPLLLMISDPKRRHIVFQIMKDKYCELIKKTRNFKTIKHLSDEECRTIYDAMKLYWPKIIETVFHFKQVLTTVLRSDEQRTEFYESMKHKLPKLIEDYSDLCAVFKCLTTQQCMEVYNNLCDGSPDAAQLGIALQALAPKKHTEFFKIMKNQLVNIISNASEFNKMLANIPAVKYTAICKEMRDYLTSFIIDIPTLQSTLQALSASGSAACMAFCTVMQKDLLQLIKNEYDYNSVFNALNTTQQQAFSTVMQDRLAQFSQKQVAIPIGRTFGLWCANREENIQNEDKQNAQIGSIHNTL